jgi:hypothetical protein
MGWRFLVAAGVVFAVASCIKIPPIACRVPLIGQAVVEIVDVADQREAVERLSSRALFFGPRDEEPPECLKLPEWEAMPYREPSFTFP